MRLGQNVAVALLSAALCILAPLAVPLGPVPVSLATLGVYVAAGLLGPWRGAAAVGLYLLLGGIGVPVFAGFTGGFQQLIGVTGGFLWGYLLCAVTAGLLLRIRFSPAFVPLWLAAGTAVLYAAGAAWYMVQTGLGIGAALLTCVVPFIPGDVVKIAVATALILPLRGRVCRLLTAIPQRNQTERE